MTAVERPAGALVVLRGNSGSGKSTVARMVQSELGPGACLVVSQDVVRRQLLDDADRAEAVRRATL